MRNRTGVCSNAQQSRRHSAKHEASNFDSFRRFQLHQSASTQAARLDRSHCPRLARRAGLAAASGLSPHSLRHTAITEILDATGGDLRRAQDFAGHADPRTTRRYDRRRDQLDNHGAYLLAGRFSDTEPG